jgi:3-keto-disaccharide hydrolase
MRILTRTVLLAAASVAAALAADSGWQTLFDGKTFAHWEDPSKKSPPGDSFVIEDGCLKAVGRPHITEDLFSTDTYRDFELEVDWKISPGGNTGIKYRIQDHVFLLDQRMPRFEDQVNAALKDRRKDRPSKGQDYVVGFEYQLIDNARNPDALRGGALHQAGALYDMFPPLKDATKPVGEFNHSRLVVKGDHVEHWLNGVKVVDASLKDPAIARACAKRWGVDSPVYNLLVNQPREACHFSLQNHDSDAWFKNIRIRRLD